MAHSTIDDDDNRPDFMVTLGLAPPYVSDDVKRAYFEKAKTAHPDHGGSAAAFNELHEAFQRATEFVEFRGDRRGWIAAKMERYVALEAAANRLRGLGATVVITMPVWLEQSFGDFAQLAEHAEIVRAMDLQNGNEVIAALIDEQPALREVGAMELSGCRVSDGAVLRLAAYQQLRRLNLANTPVTSKVLALVDELPLLETLALDGTQIGWWDRHRTSARLKKRALAE